MLVLLVFANSSLTWASNEKPAGHYIDINYDIISCDIVIISFDEWYAVRRDDDFEEKMDSAKNWIYDEDRIKSRSRLPYLFARMACEKYERRPYFIHRNEGGTVTDNIGDYLFFMKSTSFTYSCTDEKENE